MRSGGRLWMVDFADRHEHEPYDELPLYFKTRRGAKDYALWLNDNPDEYGDPVAAFPAPDDVTVRDIAWDDE